MINQTEEFLLSSSDFEPDALGPFSLDTVHLYDCVEAMRQMPDNSVDLVIADPPYNASKGNKWKWDNSVKLPGFGGNWSKIMADWDDMPLSDYLAFTIAWLAEVKRVVRPTGSVWVHGTFHNIGIINFAMQLLQIEMINEVVWYKRNSFPNLSGRRLTASHETILWAHTGKKKRDYFFNYEAAKALGCDADSLKVPGKQLRTVWDIPNNKKRRELDHGKHPAQKPLRLLNRMLEISGNPGEVVLVPFAGSGSECVAAKELGFHFLGFENDESYIDLCGKRIADATAPVAKHTLPTSSRNGHADSSSNGSQLMLTSEKRRSVTSIPPLIKWTGSKRSQALRISELVPDHERYFEPFLGGGALLYLMGRQGAVAGDIYEPLIRLWKTVQDNPRQVIEDYTQQWHALQSDLPAYFYTVRERFNQEPNPLDLNFLVRTCVNGIIRFNGSGEFNNSFHLSRKGMRPERFTKVVNAWHDSIRDVTFVCQDYEDTLSDVKEGDFVYLDPPYAGNNMRYTVDLDLPRFFEQLESLNVRKVRWALSFDGRRGDIDLSHPVPEQLYARRLLIPSGNSAVGKVLNGPVEPVQESLYLNF